MAKIHKGDQVIIGAGKDKGKSGFVLQVLSAEKLLIQGINLVKKHAKPNPIKGVAGGIVSKEMPIHISNVALLNPQTQKADKVAVKVLEDGRKVRIYKSNGESVEL
jgi:large subunit ribosomal protein L24